MKNLLKIFIFSLFLTVSFVTVKAQETPPAEDNPQVANPRPNLLRELGLTREQIQAIRRLNAAKKLEIEEAQRKAAETRKNLDQAIYADNTNDVEVGKRLEEFQKAQSEVFKIRASIEYEIRKILTPEQVVRFRQLRERFAQRREDIKERRQENQQNRRTFQQRRFNNRQNQPPNN